MPISNHNSVKMSQPTMTNKKGGKQGAKQAGKEAGNQTAKTNSGKTRQLAEAALSISGEVGGPFLGGHDLIPLESEVKLFIVRSTMPDADPWIGFKIDIPLVAGTDESGFGALYQPNSDPQIIEQPVLSTGHMITVCLTTRVAQSRNLLGPGAIGQLFRSCPGRKVIRGRCERPFVSGARGPSVSSVSSLCPFRVQFKDTFIYSSALQHC